MSVINVGDRVVRVNAEVHNGKQGNVLNVKAHGYVVLYDNGNDNYWDKDKTRKLTKLEKAMK